MLRLRSVLSLLSRSFYPSVSTFQGGFQRAPQEYPQGKDSTTESKLAKMGIVFTCTVCESRVARTFTRRSYEKGVVIVRLEQKDGCTNSRGSCLHLIADNLGWFEDNPVNVEMLVARRGETVQHLMLSDKKVIEEKLSETSDRSNAIRVTKTDNGDSIELLIAEGNPPAEHGAKQP